MSTMYLSDESGCVSNAWITINYTQLGVGRGVCRKSSREGRGGGSTGGQGEEEGLWGVPGGSSCRMKNGKTASGSRLATLGSGKAL